MSNLNKSSSLTKAKNEKNDEFYTQLSDIEKEIQAYLDFNPDVFSGKTVLLPCDDPEWSNFTRYFAQNFTRLGLKKLISTSFTSKPKQHGKILTLTQDNADLIDVNNLEWAYLASNGDFRNDEIRALRDEADIIVTNPPFSLFREFLVQSMIFNT